MIKNLFNFNRRKTLPEAVLFYAVCVVVYVILAYGAEGWLNRGF